MISALIESLATTPDNPIPQRPILKFRKLLFSFCCVGLAERKYDYCDLQIGGYQVFK